MKKTLFFAALTLVAVRAFACPSEATEYNFTRDLRPVDGNFEKISVVQDADGHFTAKKQTITSGFGSPIKTINQDLGHFTTCVAIAPADALTTLTCTADARPVDGPLVELKFVQNEGGNFTATLHKEIVSRMGSHSETKVVGEGLQY